MANENSHVKTVIEVLHDGHKGFADIGEHLKDAQIKEYFLKESATRATFATELELAAGFEKRSAGPHRVRCIAPGDIKAHLGGGDHTLLETAKQGEDAAKRAYKDALEDPEVVGAVRQILEHQQTHIRSSHDQVKVFRDSTK